MIIDNFHCNACMFLFVFQIHFWFMLLCLLFIISQQSTVKFLWASFVNWNASCTHMLSLYISAVPKYQKFYISTGQWCNICKVQKHRRLQSYVGNRARLGYAAFDVQLQKAYFVTTLYPIRTSVHAYAICWWPRVFASGPGYAQACRCLCAEAFMGCLKACMHPQCECRRSRGVMISFATVEDRFYHY